MVPTPGSANISIEKMLPTQAEILSSLLHDCRCEFILFFFRAIEIAESVRVLDGQNVQRGGTCDMTQLTTIFSGCNGWDFCRVDFQVGGIGVRHLSDQAMQSSVS